MLGHPIVAFWGSWRTWQKRWARGLALVPIMCLLQTGIGHAATLDAWLTSEEDTAIQRLVDPLVKPGDGPVALLASSAPNDPSYRYHWVRDAAGVMRSMLNLYQTAQAPEDKQKYFNIFMDYAIFSRKIQVAPNLSGGVGEPKFHPDGTPYLGDWARPQSDGPATRAIVFISWAQVLLKEGREDLVRSLLYDGVLPTSSLIKTDLEYVANNWQLPSFDLWEEVKGDHFFTRMMERRALLDGAKLAQELGDSEAAAWYSKQAQALQANLETFWDQDRKVLVPMRNQVAGPLGRESGLDSSVVLGLLLGHTEDGFMPFTDEKALATVNALERRFKNLYPINQDPTIPGIAIGRYPEDRFDGYSSTAIGNPWVPMTATFAQFFWRLAREMERERKVVITPLSKHFFADVALASGHTALVPGIYADTTAEFEMIVRALRARGDAYLARIQYHSGPDGELSEQMNRETGYMQGAQHLGLSYATFLWATWARRGDFPVPTMALNP